ncbi:MAG: AAA family ATPase [Deltaproteobacteria bacterium]|nr:AAA family ATPase [Deltaproteobacteria bacterium]
MVATVLSASGAPPPALVHHANASLQRLGLTSLEPRDFVVSTPEELAPLVPPHLRDALGDLLLDLTRDDAMRRRLALAYLAIWGLRGPSTRPVTNPEPGAMMQRLARAVIGDLPRHQQGAVAPEELSVNHVSPLHETYRAPNGQAQRPGAPIVDPLRAKVQRVQREMLAVLEAVDRVVIGKRDVIARVLVAMAARGHVLLVDAPGVGKTLLCKTMARALGIRFGRVQLTPDLMPMDVTGATIYDPRASQFVFRPGPIFTNILLADEINRATPKTQSALLEVMEERTVTIDGQTHAMADPFQVLATMNPLDHDGTYPLPAAQIDRFMSMIEMGYPTQDDEVRVLDTHLAASGPNPTTIEPVIDTEGFVEWQRTVPLVHASPEVKRAAAAYVDGLRRSARHGHTVSPRATLAWMRAAQARAIFDGREFVTVADLHDVAPEILRHRLWVSAPEVRDRLRAMSGHGP